MLNSLWSFVGFRENLFLVECNWGSLNFLSVWVFSNIWGIFTIILPSLFLCHFSSFLLWCLWCEHLFAYWHFIIVIGCLLLPFSPFPPPFFSSFFFLLTGIIHTVLNFRSPSVWSDLLLRLSTVFLIYIFNFVGVNEVFLFFSF